MIETKELTAIDRKVREAQISQLYKQTKTGLIGGIIVAITACVLFWQVIPQWKLSLWLGIILIITFARYYSIFIYQKKTSLKSNINLWANIHVISVVISGLAWTIPFVFLWPSDYSVYLLVWPLIILPLVAGSVATYYTWTPSYVTFLVISAVSISVRFFFEGGFLFIIIGFLTLFFIGILLRTGKAMHDASLRSFTFGIRNKALNDNLKEVIKTKEQLNVQLQQEITERKLAERDLTISKAYAETANATKDKFFKIISHDLRSPFNSLLGFSNLLNTKYDSIDDIKRRDYIEKMNISSNYAFNLLENLLSWARTQTDEIKIKKENLNLKTLVTTSISTYLINAESKNISIINNVDPELIISIDENTSLTFIRNLVSNAIKFTPNGGLITIDSHINEDSIKLHIADTGVGMTPEVIERLFQIDKSASTYGTDNEKGTGLGLILCKEFIERNGGSITVKSKVNKGSEFIVTLPI